MDLSVDTNDPYSFSMADEDICLIEYRTYLKTYPQHHFISEELVLSTIQELWSTAGYGMPSSDVPVSHFDFLQNN